jgi:hypothetical protein
MRMIEPLGETETLCRGIITVLTSAEIPKDSAQAMKSRIEAMLPKIVESKKKLMLRSPKGRELAAGALNNATKLNELINSTQAKNGPAISSQLELLENSVNKIEIYWKSFEYVTT